MCVSTANTSFMADIIDYELDRTGKYVPAVVSGTYSLSRLYSENNYPSDNPEAYRKGQYFVANAFWNVTSNMQVGVEYLRGWRTDFNSSTRHANRLNMLVQYSF